MTRCEDGEPAFPASAPGLDPRTPGWTGGGLTIRDYFAAKAMQAEIITSTSDATPESAEALIKAANRAGRTPMEHLAFNAYEWADAMLAARTA